jgi:nicotinate-nucleotide adenylyltransferase
MEIALFGTSADPPTIAHQQIITWLASQFDHVAVWAADNPFKNHGASLENRSRMLELLIEEIEPSITERAQVYPNLSDRYTLETISRAQKLWEDGDFTLVVGADILPQLPKWYRVNELLTQVKLLVIPRPGNDINEADIFNLNRRGANIAIATLNTPTVSSTAIREWGASTGITPQIANYIHQHQLYQNVHDRTYC